MGEGNLQLAAAKELSEKGIECDDPTKAHSIYESNKCAKGEGNLQLATQQRRCVSKALSVMILRRR